MDYAVEISHLTKTFRPNKTFYRFLTHPFRVEKPITALHDISLRIKKGELLTLVGPNGAGKSTLLKILSCLILPTSGKAKIAGHDVVKNPGEVKMAIGLISGDERSFYWRLTLRQNLSFFAALYNVFGNQAEERMKYLASFLQLTPHLDRRFQETSTGIRQRMMIARSLLNNPSVLFMDEPNKSLDIAINRELFRTIEEELINKQGKTIILATHTLSEIHTPVTKIAIMKEGEIKACGTIEELTRSFNVSSKNTEHIYKTVIQDESYGDIPT